MIKKGLIASLLLVMATLVSLAIITQRYLDKEELQRMTDEMTALRQHKDVLAALVNALDEKQANLKQEIAEKNDLIYQNNVTIEKLDAERIKRQWRVRGLRDENELDKNFAVAFPQVIHAKNFGIVHMPISAESTITLPYYVIPAWFAETFIIEHNNMLAYGEEVKQFKANEALYGNVIELKESVIQLQIEKSAAYQEGYDKAFVKYDQLNQDYIELLKSPPKVEIKAPSLWPILGSSLLGVTLGVGL